MFIQFVLKPIPPFRLDLTVWALRRRSINEVDQWDGRYYTRILVYKNQPLKMTVCQEGSPKKPKLIITAESRKLVFFPKNKIIATLKKILGININLDKFYQLVSRDQELPDLKRFIGLKPPCFPTVFETAVNAIACQQVTLDVGIKMLNRLSQRFGAVYDKTKTLVAFPTPENLCQLKIQDLRRLGFSRQKSKAVIELAQAVVNGRVELEKLENENLVDVYTYLRNIKGIGRWSSEYILLRGLRKLNVFPGDDSGTQKKLQEYFHTSGKLNYEEVKKLTYRWQPYAGFIYFHLLLNKIFKKQSSHNKQYLYSEVSSSTPG